MANRKKARQEIKIKEVLKDLAAQNANSPSTSSNNTQKNKKKNKQNKKKKAARKNPEVVSSGLTPEVKDGIDDESEFKDSEDDVDSESGNSDESNQDAISLSDDVTDTDSSNSSNVQKKTLHDSGAKKANNLKLAFPLKCQTCYENLGKMKKAENEMRIAQHKANQYEQQATKTAQLETELAKVQSKFKNANEHREIERIEKVDAQKSAEKYKEMAKKAEKLEKRMKEMEIQMKEKIGEIGDLKGQLAAQAEKAEKVEKLEKKMEGRKDIEDKLRSSKKTLSEENEQLKQENIIWLKDLTATLTKNEELEDQIKKDKKASSGTIKSLTTKCQSLEQSEDELSRKFELKHKNYVELTRKIASLTTSNSNLTEQLVSLQQENERMNDQLGISFTTVTPRRNSTVFSNASTVPQETGLPDTNCAVCHKFRQFHEEITGCENCSRVYHSECLENWLDESDSNKNCPNCMEKSMD